MEDLISRHELCQYALNQKDKSVTPNDIMRFPSADTPIGLISKKDVKWQFTEWINELNEAIDMLDSIPSAEPLVLTCNGCRHVGTYDTDFPCSGCIRREKDYYEQER